MGTLPLGNEGWRVQGSSHEQLEMFRRKVKMRLAFKGDVHQGVVGLHLV